MPIQERYVFVGREGLEHKAESLGPGESWDFVEGKDHPFGLQIYQEQHPRTRDANYFPVDWGAGKINYEIVNIEFRDMDVSRLFD